MPQYNIDRIKVISGDINAALTKLDKIKSLSKSEFLASPEKIDSAKYNLIVITEGAVDICNHVSVKAGGRAPHSYSDCFAILEELKLFAPETSAKLKQMAKFRNLLVHRYSKVDDSRVFDIIQNDISILREYLSVIYTFVTEQSHQESKK